MAPTNPLPSIYSSIKPSPSKASSQRQTAPKTSAPSIENFEARIGLFAEQYDNLPAFKDRGKSWARYFPGDSIPLPTADTIHSKRGIESVPPVEHRNVVIQPKPFSANEIPDRDGDVKMVGAEDEIQVNSITTYVKTCRDYSAGANVDFEDEGLFREFFLDSSPTPPVSSERLIQSAGSLALPSVPELSLKQHVPESYRPIRQPVSSAGSSIRTQTYFVVDTNFFLSHLDIVNDLKTLAEKYSHVIMVPKVVISELDGLKKSTRMGKGADLSSKSGSISNTSIGYLARWANNWIYDSIAVRHPGVLGQQVRQSISQSNMQPDDAILDCCLYFHEHDGHSAIVVLLSNDKNLCNKVLVDGMLTVSYRQGMTAEKIAKMAYAESLSKRNETVEYQETDKDIDVAMAEDIHETVTPPVGHPTKSPPHLMTIKNFEEATATCRNEITTIFTSAVHECMVHGYQEDLFMVDYNRQKVSNLESGCRVIGSFWTSVFSDYFPRSSEFWPVRELGRGKMAPTLMCMTPTSKSELRDYVRYWSNVLKSLYTKRDTRQRESLEMLVDRWENIAGNCDPST